MNSFWLYLSRINLFVWIAGVFIAHAVMYFWLGTATWLSTSFLATAVWAVALYALKAWGKSKNPAA